MATSVISTFNRKFVLSAATRRYGSPHRLGNGRLVATIHTDSNSGLLKKASSDTNINLLGGSTTKDLHHRHKRCFGTGYKSLIYFV